MNEDTTQELPDNRSFEEKALSALHDLDARLQRLEACAYDTKPIWERALAEIVELRHELTATKREITRRLDRIESVTLQNRVELSEMDDRVSALETQSSLQ
jgi:hypothetical protein